VPKKEILSKLRKSGVVAVIRTRTASDLITVSRALSEGGVLFVEITMTIPGALGVIQDAVDQLKDAEVYIGAGTVLDANMARNAIDSGAQFIVGPGYDPETVRLCNNREIIVIPGALTPHEILTAWKGGADVVKIFPAENLGGPDYLRAIKEPLPQVELMPTKGVNLETAEAYLRAGAIAVGVGGALVSNTLIASKDFARITQNAEKFSRIVREFRGTTNEAGPN
jgi:2-dehydro-3-deoxyphosphogluconate aldolase/(4S)-4-hydroxy-2-oxoglutarate aldolase